MKIVIIDDDNLVSLSLNTILSAPFFAFSAVLFSIIPHTLLNWLIL